MGADMKKWIPNHSLETVEERTEYVNKCINSGEYNLDPVTMDRMGSYILHPHDTKNKQRSKVKVKKTPTDKLKQILEYQMTGIKYRTPYACKRQTLTKEDKMKLYPDTVPYYMLIEELDAKGVDENKDMLYNGIVDMRNRNPYLIRKLNEIGSKSTAKMIYDEIDGDIREVIEQYKSEVKIEPFKSDLVDISAYADIDYTDEKVMKIILKNFNEIKMVALKKPSHVFMSVYIDIDNALNDINFTKKQTEIINLVLSGQVLKESHDKRTFYRAVDKICNYFLLQK